MNLSHEEFEKIVHKKLRNNQLLLAISIFISLSIFIISSDNVFWSIYFLAIGALSLSNINHCKSDLKDFKNTDLEMVKGKVLDVFPENETEKNWILFLEEENSSKIREFIVPFKPSLQMEQECEAHYTPKMEILVKIV